MRVRTILILAITVLGLGGLLLSGGAPALADIVGNGGDNTLNGNARQNVMYGRGGADRIFGKENKDWLYGEKGNDELHGGDGDDTLHGGKGSDTGFGEGGNDEFYFVEGTNRSRQQPPPPQERADQLNGGEGDDTFVTVDGKLDIIDCGPGNDRAWIDADPNDPTENYDRTTIDCETVHLCPFGQPGMCEPPPPRPTPPPGDRASRFSL
jgi:Ca2+-binding RTX toxin-like protein